ncbi:unnamed protein product [Caenorhabditis bovis]|uniref:Uncharacterized protein n=1 Tax=Caenorhabditis bovis TaxID=2654633 RepID=A0A8S1EY66_9PELO|nr:unnamed protein product [Caenorhabditis bovis]
MNNLFILLLKFLLFEFTIGRECEFGQCADVSSNYIADVYEDIKREFTSQVYIQTNSDYELARNYSIAALTAVRLTKKKTGGKLPKSLCPLKKYRCAYGKYRHVNGRCTNVWWPLAGATMTQFSRRIHANYEDDIGAPRFVGRGGGPLPSASFVDENLPKARRGPPIPLTQTFVDFAELIYQDLVRLAHFQEKLTCCNTESSECLALSNLDCYVRSAPAPTAKCEFGRREQMNLATSFLDAGPVYQSGKHLKTGKFTTHFTSDHQNPLVSLFEAEHNYIYDKLKKLYPHHSQQTILEEARKFVIAELQFITYHEFLPILIGDDTMARYDLDKAMCSGGMCENLNPNTLNEFAAAVGLFFKFMDDDDEKKIGDSSTIRRPFIYRQSRSSSAKSLLAEIVMLGRDHGLATYAQWREECGGGELETFDQLGEVIDAEILDASSRMFGDVRDVDLFLFGLSEYPVYGSLVGPTFGCILALQFQKTKFGDPYWYENVLTSDQLDEIRKSSISSLLCRHAKVENAQTNGFIVPDAFTNIPIKCNSTEFPTIDLSKWMESESLREPIETKFDELLGICIEKVNEERLRRSNPDNFQHGLFNSASIGKYAKMMLAKDEAVIEANISFILLEATHKLINERQLNLADIQGIHVGDDFRSRSIENCNPKPLPCDPTNPYRTYTGWCNNLKNPGAANTFAELKRLLQPAYDDGISAPRSKSVSGGRLSSPRIISNAVHSAAPIENVKYTHLLMEFGQFIDHDITHSPVDQNADGTPLNCSSCDASLTVSPSCYPIPVPESDRYFPSSECLSFVRSLPAQKTLGYRNQMNQITAYLDGSVMYGSTQCEGDRLRTFTDGKLKVTRLGKQSHYGITLSQSDDSEQDGCVSSPNYPCFIAGDDRNSQQTLLIAVHSIFHREHDRVSTILKNLNEKWDDERIYQETRKLISAEFAHVVYNQYLPIIVGQNMMDEYELRPLKNGYFDGYEECDASILQPFAAAAFRFGHSTVTRYTPMQFSPDEPIEKVVDLASEFLNMSKIYDYHGVDEILGGMRTQRQMATDRYVDDSVRNFLFSDRGKIGTGLDLISINIQRGRDHAIQPYNQYREWCGLPKLTSFHSVFSDIEPNGLEAISRVYDSPDDIDLFTGIVSEKTVAGGIVGPTAACLIAEQFRRLKKCDRFYYENGNEYTRFTKDQLQEIRKVSLSSLICANSKLEAVSRDVFSVPDQFLNALIDCKLFEQIDFTKWKDDDYCSYKRTRIARHSTKAVSPCSSCTCTRYGLKCYSVAPDCARLFKSHSKEEILEDTICYMQCAYYSRS